MNCLIHDVTVTKFHRFGRNSIGLVEFLPNPLTVIAQHNHPLAKERNIRLSTLIQESFLVRENESGTRHAMGAFFEQQKLTPNIHMTIKTNVCEMK